MLLRIRLVLNSGHRLLVLERHHLKTQMAGSAPRTAASGVPGWGLGMCISRECPGAAATSGLWTTF